MKNLINSLFCIAVIALGTSCQQEEITSTMVDDSMAEASFFQSGTIDDEIQTMDKITSMQIWNLCGEDYKVWPQQQGGISILTIFGQGVYLPITSFTQIEYDLLDPKVMDAMESMGMKQPDVLWQSFDPSDKFVLVEFILGNGMTEIHLFDTDGNHVCKGYHK